MYDNLDPFLLPEEVSLLNLSFAKDLGASMKRSTDHGMARNDEACDAYQWFGTHRGLQNTRSEYLIGYPRALIKPNPDACGYEEGDITGVVRLKSWDLGRDSIELLDELGAPCVDSALTWKSPAELLVTDLLDLGSKQTIERKVSWNAKGRLNA